MKYFEKPKRIIICSIIYILIWIASLLTFWLYIKGDGEGVIVWGVFFMILIMPCTTMISSSIISFNIKNTDRIKRIISYFLIVAIFTALFFILGFVTFDLNVMIATKQSIPVKELESLLSLKFGFVSAIIGTLIGALINVVLTKNRKKKKTMKLLTNVA